MLKVIVLLKWYLHPLTIHFIQGSVYLQAFNKVMWRVVQAGLIRKWLQDLYILHKRENLAKVSSENNKEKSELSQNDNVVSLRRLSDWQIIAFHSVK